MCISPNDRDGGGKRMRWEEITNNTQKQKLSMANNQSTWTRGEVATFILGILVGLTTWVIILSIYYILSKHK
jgi:hypothetical protein